MVSFFNRLINLDTNLRRLARISTLRDYYNVDDADLIVNTSVDEYGADLGSTSSSEVYYASASSTIYDYVSSSITCPDGYTYTNGECITRISEVPTVGCGSGMYLRSDGICQGADRIAATKGCPTGYTESTSETCLRTLTTMANFVCDTNYVLDIYTSTCKRSLSTSSNLLCPTNSVRSGDLCYSTSSVGKVMACAANFQLVSDGTCRLVVNPTTSEDLKTTLCPADYELMDGLCVSISKGSLTATCSSGTTESSDSTCQKTSTVAASVDCADPSFTLSSDGKTCSLTLTTTPILACPEGYAADSADPSRCLSSVRAIKDAYCPSGYNLLYGSTCQKDNAATSGANCRTGLTFNSKTRMCETTQTVNPIAGCPSGWAYDSLNMNCRCPAGVCSTAPTVGATVGSTEQPIFLGYDGGDGYYYAYHSGQIGPNGGTIVNSNGNSYEVVQQEVSAPPATTIYHPQYIVLPSSRAGEVRVITPT